MKFGKFSAAKFHQVCDEDCGIRIRRALILSGRTPAELYQGGYQSPGLGARRVWRELRRGALSCKRTRLTFKGRQKAFKGA